MRILLIEPYLSDSHQSWAEGFQEHSDHQVELLTLPGRHWKWRMHGAAVQLSEACLNRTKPDLILASEMLDLATFRGLLPDNWRQIPCVLYFHENQLTYPWSEQDQDQGTGRDLHYAWIHLTGALAAEEVWFNSTFHQEEFLKALEAYLHRLPGPSILHRFQQVKDRSRVMPLGIQAPLQAPVEARDPRLILWNHRWEYDKDPDAFFRVIQKLKAAGEEFRLVILGKAFEKSPSVFMQVTSDFADEIIHMGYVAQKEEYWSWLDRASWAPVTSRHDFFGVSVMEAAARGVVPILPGRLSYPDLFSDFPELFYEDEEQLFLHIRKLLGTRANRSDALRKLGGGYHWSIVGKDYDHELTRILSHPEKRIKL